MNKSQVVKKTLYFHRPRGLRPQNGTTHECKTEDDRQTQDSTFYRTGRPITTGGVNGDSLYWLAIDPLEARHQCCLSEAASRTTFEAAPDSCGVEGARRIVHFGEASETFLPADVAGDPSQVYEASLSSEPSVQWGIMSQTVTR